jgi:ribosomal protein L24E
VPVLGHIPEDLLRPLPRTVPRLSSGPSSKALRLFVALTLHPNWDNLAGPCKRPGCGKYYIRDTSRNRVYCSKKCGTKVTAKNRNNERNRQERVKKLHEALEAIHELKLVRSNRNWKQLVHDRHPHIKTNFLTRAVNEAARDAGTAGRDWSAKQAAELLKALMQKLDLQSP